MKNTRSYSGSHANQSTASKWWRSRIFWEAIIAIALAIMITGVIASVRFAFS
jgi:hypothetical protein